MLIAAEKIPQLDFFCSKVKKYAVLLIACGY